MKKVYMSDKIGKEYKKWRPDFPQFKNVLISGGTGTGKTYFILHKFLEHCAKNGKSILYLCNRRALKKQLEDSVADLPEDIRSHITFGLYQRYSRFLRYCDRAKAIYGDLYNAFLRYLGTPAQNAFIELLSMDKYKEIVAKGHNNQSGRFIWNNLDVSCLAPPGPDIAQCLFRYGPNSILAKIQKAYRDDLYRHFDFYVCDEIHYLLQDASFNFDTYDLFKKLIELHTADSVFIYMSATTYCVRELLQYTYLSRIQMDDRGIFLREYSIPTDYSYIVPRVVSGDIELVRKIKESGEDKWLIFVESIKHGETLERLINEAYMTEKLSVAPCRFLYRSPGADNMINKIQKHGAFADIKCLIATSILDNGIDIRHKDFRHLAVITWDSTEFIQMVGRKRIDDPNSEKLHLYIYERSRIETEKFIKKLYERKSVINDALCAAENAYGVYRAKIYNSMPYGEYILETKDKFRFILKYCNSPDMFRKLTGLVRFTENGFNINWLAFTKNNMMIDQYEEWLNDPNFTLATKQLGLLGINYAYAPDPEKNAVLNLLRSKAGIGMDNRELRELKTELNSIIRKINQESLFPMKKVNTTSSTKALNKWLCGIDCRYYIDIEVTDKHTHKRIYTVHRLDKDEYLERKKAYCKEEGKICTYVSES